MSDFIDSFHSTDDPAQPEDYAKIQPYLRTSNSTSNNNKILISVVAFALLSIPFIDTFLIKIFKTDSSIILLVAKTVLFAGIIILIENITKKY